MAGWLLSCYHRRRLLTHRITSLVVLVAGLAAGCSGSSSPVAPGGAPSYVPAFALTPGDVDRITIDCCPGTLIVGQRVVCAAFAHLKTGGTTFVSFYAQWSSSNEEAVSVFGALVFGRSDGTAVVTVTFLGHTATAAIATTFPEHDALDVSSFTSGGPFRPGATATLWLGVTYTVVTAPAGELRVQVSDQRGVVAAGTADSVARGADLRTLGTTFAIPQDSTRLCAVAILQVNTITVAAPSDAERFCVPVIP
jgi:hypothetical protein